MVEAQHRISTNRLAESAADQAILENLAEAVKPDLPKAARGLHYLLASPFRYGHGVASRFRGANERPGIFYASEHEAAAIAETAYWRLRFLARSPGLNPPRTVGEHSSFSVALDAARALDLTRPPFDVEAQVWRSDDYSRCQELAASARTASAQAIRYASARDPEGRANIALFDAGAFAERRPRHGRTWHLRIEHGRLTAIAALPASHSLSFAATDFGIDLPG